MTEKERIEFKEEMVKTFMEIGRKNSGQITFNSKNLVTSLLIFIVIGLIGAGFKVWTNDTTQDYKIEAILKMSQQTQQTSEQTQKNQVILGEKFDDFADEPRYTKKIHDVEMAVKLAEFEMLKPRVDKNFEDITILRDNQRNFENKLEVFELKSN